MRKIGTCNSIEEVVRQNVEKNFPVSFEEFMEDKGEPYIENLDETISLINSFLDSEDGNKKNITIVGDYDCDGISATTIMAAGIMLRGTQPKLRIPHRFSEGYGINERIIDSIDDGLLITVDNGIAAIDAIKKAKEKGLTVIITDHHLAAIGEDGNKVLPEADIILDPHVNPENSGFEDYCGAGIAYRIARGLNPDKELRTLLVLASIATVADVMPLYGANRMLVKEGLQAIHEQTDETVLPGLSALLALTRLGDHINEVDYGFTLAPLFNAPGRLHDDGSEMVVRLLTMGKRNPELLPTAERVVNNNNRRKELVRLAMDEIRKQLMGGDEVSEANIQKPIVVYQPGIGEGVVGLIAGRLCEEYRCPVICLTDSKDDGILKGSARSIPEIHVKNVLDSIQNLCYKYGGHAGAAGLSIKEENFAEFKDAFRKACEDQIEGEYPWDRIPEIEYDLELVENSLDALMEEQQRFAPYGEGNPKPIFHRVCNIDPATVNYLGQNAHIKFISEGVTFLGFNIAKKYRELGEPSVFHVSGTLEESWFRGERSYQFQIADMEGFGV